MFEKIPTLWIVLAVLAVLLMGPVTFFAFLLGGSTAGVTAVMVIFLLFVAAYIIVVRHYG